MEIFWATAPYTYVIFGEQHGTVETPEAFADIVCGAAQAVDKPIVVGLEFPARYQAALDSYVSSDGGKTARKALSALEFWHQQEPDGRSSVAVWALLDRLRIMKSRGMIAGVPAFAPDSFKNAAAYERTMAENLSKASQENKRMVIALVGNKHAMLDLFRGEYEPAAMLLPQDNVVTINVLPNGGSQWACYFRPDGETFKCGSRQFKKPEVSYNRGIRMADRRSYPYSAILYLGLEATTSAPKFEK